MAFSKEIQCFEPVNFGSLWGPCIHNILRRKSRGYLTEKQWITIKISISSLTTTTTWTDVELTFVYKLEESLLSDQSWKTNKQVLTMWSVSHFNNFQIVEIPIRQGDIQKLCWPLFLLFWPPTYLRLTSLLNSLIE